MSIINSTEISALAKVLQELERDTKETEGLNQISGGFAIADMIDYDEEVYTLQLKWGVQSDCTDNTHKESHKIKRSIIRDKDLTTVEKVNTLYT